MKGMVRYSAISILAVMLGLLSSCGGAKLSLADEQMERGEYFAAAATYRKVYNKLKRKEDRSQRGEIAYKMGLCYDKLSMSSRAAVAFNNAIRFGVADSSLYLLLGRSLQSDGKYRQAMDAYTIYLQHSPESKEAEIGISGCRIAMDAKENPTRYKVARSRIFNTGRSDFAPMYYDRSYDRLYFTSSSAKNKGESKSEITGLKRGDIWMARKNEFGQWMRPEAVEGELNSEADEGIVSFSPDGTTMYLTRARRDPHADTGVEIYVSRRTDAQWSAPVRYDITADTISSYGHPAVSADGSWLYFTSDMPGGYGGKDIWRVNLLEPQGSLENLGPFINTPGDEMFPYSRTDSVLYFASDGHPGFGGLDLFKATLTPSGGWNVENMGQPMNSSADDFGITFGAGETGFFSSNRADGAGRDHIYSFELPDLKIIITGTVTDMEEDPVDGAIIRIVGNDGSNRKERARPDGTFRFPLQRGVSYVMMAGADGYLNAKQEFTADEAEEDAEYEVDFVLASATKPVVVENILYDYNKATLREESAEALDAMVKVLTDNPNITIEMGAHTDRHGSDRYNDDLSLRRAKSVTDYLEKAGIAPDRLTVKGWGKRSPKVITKRLARLYPMFAEGTVLTAEFIETLSGEERAVADQINRRTEFRVVSTDYDMY